MQDLTKVNYHFGTEQDLKDLINAWHSRDIYVISDVVANHVGPVRLNYSTIVPFNK